MVFFIYFACLQYKATSDKSAGKPNHFRVYLASIDSTLLVEISYTNCSHNNIGINICWRHQTLNFPCSGQLSILWRPSYTVLDVSFAWLMSFKDPSDQHPKLSIDFRHINCVLTFKLRTYTKLNCLKWNSFWNRNCTYTILNGLILNCFNI